jgi:hypothetical protein
VSIRLKAQGWSGIEIGFCLQSVGALRGEYGWQFVVRPYFCANKCPSHSGWNVWSRGGNIWGKILQFFGNGRCSTVSILVALVVTMVGLAVDNVVGWENYQRLLVEILWLSRDLQGW